MMVLFVSLSQAAADHLRMLVRLNRESQRCFRAAGDGVADAELTALFYRLARQRGAFVAQLSQHVDPRGEETAPDASPAAGRPALQRWWQALRQRLSADEERFTLRLAERAEDEVLAAYEGALARPLSPEVEQLLQRQRDEVVGAHEQIRALHQLRSLRRAS
ncbi:MAG: PA2169 family four-helix-bundle protein [Phycisphaeraceae bacterium]